MKNDALVIEQHYPDTTASLVKSSMSRTLVYRTNKEFDKCAELLRNILTVQETRRNSKSSTTAAGGGGEFQRKVSPSKKPIKANVLPGTEMPDRRSSYSPSKSRRHSPVLSKSRQRSPPSPSRPQPRRRPVDHRSDVIRSSSCGDLPSSSNTRIPTRLIIEQFVRHLTRIRTIAKQIRTTSVFLSKRSEDLDLWNELENSLVSALTYANDDIQYQLSLEPLRDELVELRRQLQSTNAHLRQFDVVPPTRKFSPPIGYSQLLIHNQELQSQCDLLQEKLDSLERNNIRLIQRGTQKDLRSLAERSSDTRVHLREEIYSLKEKLYHLYDDLATLFNRNHSLEIAHLEQKQELTFYKQQLSEMKQSAGDLLLELDKRTVDEKIKRFLNEIVLHPVSLTSAFHPSHTTPTNVPSSAMIFETPHKGPSRSRVSPITATAKLRPKSLFVTPTVLNDGNALSRFHQQSRSPVLDSLSPCSSSTICDAESISSLVHQQNKRMTLYNSLPILTPPPSSCVPDDETQSEFEQISDLTSKMFNSDEDRGLGVSDTSTTLPTD